MNEDGTPSTTEFLTFATTRPETMLGDTAVAIHPDDERYTHLHGRKVLLPIVNRVIPIVEDAYVDREFGTGVVKITPAHDPNDFEVGKRHNLPVINILNDDATINKNGGKFEGMDRYEARKAIVEELDQMGLLVKIEDHVHNVGTHDRCKTTIEPMVKDQWFVKMDELIKPAREAVKNGEIKLIPERMEKNYFNWTDNIRDWCISRQLWWGHRIPAYYCDDCGEVVVAKEMPKVCPKCGCTHFTQDPDTLDTWFSSALWPFETLGWPEQTADLNYWSAAARKGMYDVMCQYVDIVQELANVLTTRFNDGQISKTDLLQVQSRLKEAELNKSAAYKDYQIALQNLNVLMGVPPMTPVEIADAITTVQPLPMHIGEEAALQNLSLIHI